MTDRLTLLLFQSWDDLDRAIDGLDPVTATTRHAVASPIAWTVGHVTTQVDSWLNMRFQGLEPHPVFPRERYATGADGVADNWDDLLTGVREVRARARAFLEREPGPDLSRTIPYDGAIPILQSTGLRLDYALMCIAIHHAQHTGEIITVRSNLGHIMDEGVVWGRSMLPNP